ncbi:TIGR02391 family protein [bacterium]|nr:TIGR02391 family protein [bacterium]
MTQELAMQFNPSTIEHLGIQMYSKLPNALAELVANAYDADADSVHIKLYDNGSQKHIVIEDDGIGMAFDEVNEKFLQIGRHRRLYDDERTTQKGRIITGKKGLGKLALFGIGNNIQIQTTKKDIDKKLIFDLNWYEITHCEESEYKPKFDIIDTENNKSGTTIILSDLKRYSPFDIEGTVFALSKLFNFQDTTFKIYISLNDQTEIEVTKELKYDAIETEFSWDVSNILEEICSDYDRRDDIKGKIYTTQKPTPSTIKGVSLYVNGRMANEPGFFDSSESSHAYSYITGWVDANFIDELDDDLISTDRQSLNWETQETKALRDNLIKILRYIEASWRKQRAAKKKDETTKETNIDVDSWTGTMSEPLGKKIKKAVDSIIDEESIEPEVASMIVKHLHDIAPEYADYHFRELHKEVKDVSEEYYRHENYYTAFVEALKRYKNKVKEKSGVTATEDYNIMSESFGKDKILKVAKNKLRPNGEEFSQKTLDNIEDGQKYLSMGIVQGGRNVLSHEECKELQESGLFTEKDCLDMLSLLSHLFKRLDDA